MFVVSNSFTTEIFKEPSPCAGHHAGLWLEGVGTLSAEPSHGTAQVLDKCQLFIFCSYLTM